SSTATISESPHFLAIFAANSALTKCLLFSMSHKLLLLIPRNSAISVWDLSCIVLAARMNPPKEGGPNLFSKTFDKSLLVLMFVHLDHNNFNSDNCFYIKKSICTI